MISINYRDSRPIYEQIQRELRRMILSGGLAAGSRLPSVRELAAELAINPNTIQRAYRELESEGLILSITGKGSFVAEQSRPRGGGEAVSRFLESARALEALGYSADDLQTLLDEQEQKEALPDD
jgi:GntR family transcriptional regulator